MVVVVLGLGFAGVIPGFHLGGGSGGGGGGGKTYTVTFTESGLPAGTTWSVTSGTSTQSSTMTTIQFSVSNGSYPFSVAPVSGYTATPSSGTVVVSGAPVNQTVVFTPLAPGQYTVTFTETGLPSGTAWSVTLNSVPRSSTATQIGFTESNGTYPFSVLASGYTATPASGNVIVSGASVTQAITFSSAPPSSSVDSAQALSSATAAISGYQSQNWVPSLELGWQATSGLRLPLNSTSNCTYAGVPTVFIPKYTGNFLTGTSPFWYVEYNATTTSDLAAFVAVVNGTASILGTMTGSKCIILGSGYSLNAVSLLTSVQAVNLANSNGNVTQFLTAHPPTTAVMVVASANMGGTVAYYWTMAWESCSVSTGPILDVSINAVSGSVLYRQVFHC